MAKPLANGFPIGAIMTSGAIAEEIKVGDHGTTFGGNPLATRLAHHVFGRISSPEMLQQVTQTSKLFKKHIDGYIASFPELVDSARGRGLILGIQLKAVGNHTPSDIANLVLAKARLAGLLVITAGEGTVRLVPPLNIPEDVATRGLEILGSAFRQVRQEIV
jgi:acetylornithine aminotransferase